MLNYLMGKDAVALWLEGPEAWNDWVDKNIGVKVSFRGVNFSDYISEDEDISFSGYKFPQDAIVDFTSAKFNCARVFFNGAIFNSGIVLFNNTEFNADSIWFAGCSFDNFNTSFSNALFRAKRLEFSNAKFSADSVYFESAEFHVETFGFCNVEFDSKIVSFAGAKFLGDSIDFSGTNFGGADVNFSSVEIKSSCRFSLIKTDGFFDFSKSHLYGDECLFERGRFGGYTSFEGASFHEGCFSFEQTIFKEHLDFSGVKIHDEVVDLSFKFATFSSSCEFSPSNTLRFIPDFTGTKTTNHFVLSGLNCESQQKANLFWRETVKKTDAERLCRLKEIAESNKDHPKALQFHSEEMRAKRWHKLSVTQSFLDILFDAFSRYGQSIIRPVIGMLLCMVSLYLYTIGYALPNYGYIIFFGIVVVVGLVNYKKTIFAVPILLLFYYGFNSIEISEWFNKMGSIDKVVYWEGANLTIYKTIPFMPSLRDLGKKANETLVGNNKSDSSVKINLPEHYGVISTLLFVLPSYIFIFLIGLGLRNRFRL